MSSFSPFLVFLFYLSIHLCSAENSGPLVDKGSSGQIRFPAKGSVEEGKTDGNSIVGKSHGGAISHEKKESEGGGINEGGIPPRMNSHDWVSWRVPRKIHEGHAEFFLDYSQPRTRPPSHN